MNRRIRNLLPAWAAAAFIAGSSMMPAQSQPAFEVASIKPAAQLTGQTGRPPYSWGPSSVILTRFTLKALLVRAYEVKAYQVSGPGWLDNDRFDINAKMPEGATTAQIPLMLQALLAERFKLALHRETRPLAIYALVAARGGPKLRESGSTPPAGPSIGISLGPGGISALTGQLTTAQIAAGLTLNLPVLDMTGLTGKYDIDIKWTPDERSTPIPELAAAGGEAGTVPAASEPGPSIFTVLQDRLGLKLEARSVPIEMLVIDHTERAPTEN